MTSSSYYTIGGSLELDTPTYVARAADDELFQRVSSFELCYVLTTRQMGKSSLMIRTAKRLIDAGGRAAIIDLMTLGSGKDVTAEKWYYGVCEEIARSLELDFDFGAWWDQQQRLPLSQRFVRFLRDVVLKHNTQPVVIFVDEIDSTLNLDFSDDFFAAIRACYNARTTEPDFRRLTFVLLGVASPSDLMKDRSRTPFNIGSRVELTDFTAEEARPLAQGLADDDAARRLLLSRVLYWSDGHPYLTQALCAACQSAPARTADDVDRVVANEFLAQGKAKEDKNLRFVRDRLLGKSKLKSRMLSAYRRILGAAKVFDDAQSPVHLELKLCGVVKPHSDGYLIVRNRMYARVFDAAWLKSVTPVDWGLRVATAAVVLLMLSPGWYWLTYPRFYIAQLENAAGLSEFDLKAARENYKTLRGKLFYTGQADDLWGRLNQRRLATALEQDRAAVRQASQARQEDALKLVTSACEELRQCPGSNWKEVAEKGWADFHSQRLAEAIELDEAFAAHEPDGPPLAPITAGLDKVAMQRMNYQLALDSHERLKTSPLQDQQSKAAPLLANFFDQRAERAEYRERLGEAILWRLRRLVTEDDATTRQAVTHLVGADHVGLVRTWGQLAIPNTRIVTELERFADGDITLAMLNRDQSRLLMGTSTGVLQWWDVASGKLVETFRHDGAIRGAVLTKDKRRILTWSDDRTTRLWQFGQPQPVAVIRHPDFRRPDQQPDNRQQQSDGLSTPRILGAVLDAAESRVLTWGDDNKALLWEGSQLLQTFEHDKGINGARLSRDGKRVLTWTGDWSRQGAAYLWEVDQPKKPLQTFQHQGQVFGAVFSMDETRVLTWSLDSTACLWDITRPTPLQIFRHGEVNGVLEALFSADERGILTRGRDGTVCWWDTTKSEPAHQIQLGDEVLGMLPCGENRVLTWWDDTVELLDVAQTEPIQSYKHANRVNGVVFNRDRTRFLTWNSSSAHLWDVMSSQPLQSFKHFNRVQGAMFAADDTRVMTWGADNGVRLWDVTNSPSVSPTVKNDNGFNGAVFNHDRTRILTSSDADVRLWEVATGNLLRTFNTEYPFHRVAILSRDESHVLTFGEHTSEHYQARLWDVKTGQSNQTFELHRRVFGAALSKDSNRILIWNGDPFEFWDVATGKPFHVVEYSKLASFADGAVFCRDENRILTWGTDGEFGVAYLWDITNADPLRSFKDNRRILGATQGAEENRFLIWSDDGAARLWDVAESEPLRIFSHDSNIESADFSPNDERVLTQTSHWLHCARVAEANRNANNPSAGFQAAPKSQSNVSARAADEQVANPRRRWSRRFPGRLLGNVAWPADQNQLTVAQEWPDSRSLTIEHPRLDGYDEPPIEGEPAKLLEIWQDKLGLKINDDGQVVPSRPIPVLNALRKL